MTNTTKMTVAQKYDLVVAFLNEHEANEELVAFVLDRKEKSAKKSTSSKAKEPSKEQKEIREEIIKLLSDGSCLSISEMQKASEILGPCSTSKISGNITPILRNGKNPNPDGVLVRTMDKKVAKFSLA